MQLQAMLRLIYPAHCIACDALVETEGALCASCWRDTPFVTDAYCDCCGAQQLGEMEPGEVILCDACMTEPRPWSRGRAALMYEKRARGLVLAFKHGDRMDLAPPLARWMARAGADLITENTLFVPIPAHWTRLLKRKYNQSAVLAQHLSKQTGRPHCPDALQRMRRTPPMEGMSPTERHANVDGAFQLHPRRTARLVGRDVILVDDVMTSGSTLASAARLISAAGAKTVNVLVLARVAKPV